MSALSCEAAFWRAASSLAKVTEKSGAKTSEAAWRAPAVRAASERVLTAYARCQQYGVVLPECCDELVIAIRQASAEFSV